MKNYVIIGGSSGIGQEVVNQLTAQGNKVYSTYLKNKKSDQELVSFQQFDVMNGELDDSNFPEVIDGLVYCPGSINLKPFKRFSAQDYLDDYKLQVVGAMQVIEKLHKRLKKSESASIVLFSTVAVQNGFPFHAQVAASKGAIEGVVKTLAAEFAPTIRVNAIAPSLTDTPLAEQLLSSEDKRESNAERNPLKRLGTPTDVANAATFLLSEKASYITGQILAVDGGMGAL